MKRFNFFVAMECWTWKLKVNNCVRAPTAASASAKELQLNLIFCGQKWKINFFFFFKYAPAVFYLPTYLLVDSTKQPTFINR